MVDPAEYAAAVGRVRDIAFAVYAADPLGAQTVQHLVRLRRGRGNDDKPSLPAKRAGNAEADTAAGAGDKRDFFHASASFRTSRR